MGYFNRKYQLFLSPDTYQWFKCFSNIANNDWVSATTSLSNAYTKISQAVKDFGTSAFVVDVSAVSSSLGNANNNSFVNLLNDTHTAAPSIVVSSRALSTSIVNNANNSTLIGSSNLLLSSSGTPEALQVGRADNPGSVIAFGQTINFAAGDQANVAVGTTNDVKVKVTTTRASTKPNVMKR